MARSTARKRALNTLYEADEKGQDILSLLAERIAHPGAQTPLPDYAITIVRAVAKYLVTLDRALADHSKGWNIKRMAVVDRNILRIATWEILGNDEVPDKVAIDEALGQAKTLSDDESLSFIHGVLSALCADKDQYDLEAEAAERARIAAEKASAEKEAAEQAAAEQAKADQEKAEQAETAQTETGQANAERTSAGSEPVDVPGPVPVAATDNVPGIDTDTDTDTDTTVPPLASA